MIYRRPNNPLFWFFTHFSMMLFLLLMGCDDDSKTTTNPDCISDTDCPYNLICAFEKCLQPDNSTDSGNDADSGSDSKSDSDTVSDTSLSTDSDTTVCAGVTPTLPAGQQCTTDCECLSAHCNNGICCADGTCCQTSANCESPCSTGAVCDTATFICDTSQTIHFECGAQSTTCGDNNRCDGFGNCTMVTPCPAELPTVDSFRCFENSVWAECGCMNDKDCDDDGIFCNGVYRCDGGVCYFDNPINPCFKTSCNLQRCDEATKTCIDGDDPCQSASTMCNPQVCSVTGPEPGDYVCEEDSNYRDGRACDDGNPCNGTADKCANRQCVAGPASAAPCFDNDPCTQDNCQPVAGTPNSTTCTHVTLAEGDLCTSEFECYGQGATCEFGPSGTLECVARESVCDEEGLGLCRQYTCDDDPHKTTDLYQCSYTSNLDFTTVGCGETVEISAADFATRNNFTYNDTCNSSQGMFIGQEAIVYLRPDPDTDIMASISVVSVAPASYGGIELLRLQDACTAESCLASGTESITGIPITPDQSYPAIVIDSAQEIWPPDSVVLQVTCTPAI